MVAVQIFWALFWQLQLINIEAKQLKFGTEKIVSVSPH